MSFIQACEDFFRKSAPNNECELLSWRVTGQMSKTFGSSRATLEQEVEVAFKSPSGVQVRYYWIDVPKISEVYK